MDYENNSVKRENFFDEFFSLKNQDDLSQLQRRLIDLLDIYLQGGSWIKNEREKMIYKREQRGYKISETAILFDMTPNAYRTMLSRAGKRIKDIVFDGNSLAVSVFSSDEKIESYIDRLNFLITHFDIYKECPKVVIEMIENVTDNAADEDVSEEDLFMALVFISKFSSLTIESNLKKVRPAALKVIMEKLDSNKYEKEMGYFKVMQEISAKNIKVSPEFISKIKKMTEGRC